MYSQVRQLSVSGVTFRNNYAYVGGVLYSEAVEVEPLNCHPVACDWATNNSASSYGQVMATPPAQFSISMPISIRSGAMLPIIVTLNDLCGAGVRTCMVPYSCLR